MQLAVCSNQATECNVFGFPKKPDADNNSDISLVHNISTLGEGSKYRHTSEQYSKYNIHMRILVRPSL